MSKGTIYRRQLGFGGYLVYKAYLDSQAENESEEVSA